jgi:hypothetical protein
LQSAARALIQAGSRDNDELPGISIAQQPIMDGPSFSVHAVILDHGMAV